MPEEVSMSADLERDVMQDLAGEQQPQHAEALDEYEAGEGEGYEDEGEAEQGFEDEGDESFEAADEAFDEMEGSFDASTDGSLGLEEFEEAVADALDAEDSDAF